MKAQKQIDDSFRQNINSLIEEETALEGKHISLVSGLAGLKDIDVLYSLIYTKFRISNAVIDKLGRDSYQEESVHYTELARTKALEAVRLLEDLIDTNVSLDQKDIILKAPGYGEAKDQLYHLLMNGGSSFFNTKIEDAETAHTIAKSIAQALKRFSPADSDYEPLFHTESLPAFFKSIVNFFLPVLGRPYQKDPPYGLEDDEAVTYSSKKIKLPLSQAIHYLEEEVLPELKRNLETSPGNEETIDRIRRTENQIEEFRKITFIPRSSPVFPEKNFYSDHFTQFTESGELMVTISVPVVISSGTNLERIQKLVCAEVTRNLAGKGICPELDREYFYLKNLESGTKGSSRTPSLKLDTSMGFRMLKNTFPFFVKLENKQTFRKLLHFVTNTNNRYMEKLIRQLMVEDEYHIKALP